MNRKLFSVVFVVYIALLVCMAGATFVEKAHGSAFTSEHVYGAWWFVALWAMLVAFGVWYMAIRHMRRASTVTLHTSFVVILLGALLTHMTAQRGMIHLRVGETTNAYMSADKYGHYTTHPLGFDLSLDAFDIVYYNGTQAASDYVSKVTIADRKSSRQEVISMNHIVTSHARRLYQASYDEDGGGSTFAMNSDPWGIPVTYFGYAMLFISLLWMLVDPKGAWRRLLRHPAIKKGMIMLLLLSGLVPSLQGKGWSEVSADNQPHTLPDSCASRMGQLYIVYNNRVCPLETFAIDFTKKLYGKEHYGDYSAMQVLSGFLFWGSEWMTEPVLKMKNGALRQTMHLDKYASVYTFLNAHSGEYRLKRLVEEYWHGNQDKLHKQAAQVDDKIALIMEVCQKEPLKLFPYTQNTTTSWYSPTDVLPAEMPAAQQQYVSDILSLMQGYVHEGNYALVNEAARLLKEYQLRYGADSLPSAGRTRAENIYNHFPFVKVLFMLCLTMGFMALFVEIARLAKNHDESEYSRKSSQRGKAVHGLFVGVLMLAFAALTLCLALRWIIKGSIPMSNGYETMVLMAWSVMLVSLLASRRFGISLMFGFLLSGFFLLVAHISNMDPQISHVMPVLRSPLLSIHVSMMMMSYALLSMTFICGLTAVGLQGVSSLRRQSGRAQQPVEALAVLSRIFLYPAMTTLGFGIFIGAIWANVSWGNYWSWDPKEVWALVTFMLYAIALHPNSVPAMKKPVTYHVFMIFAFLSIVMTYFGVNYILGGMHSYA